jgi:hypothetical protein
MVGCQEIWRLDLGRVARRRTSAPLISIWPLIAGVLAVGDRRSLGSERSRHPDSHGRAPIAAGSRVSPPAEYRTWRTQRIATRRELRTRAITGEDRPKQLCKLSGAGTLLPGDDRSRRPAHPARALARESHAPPFSVLRTAPRAVGGPVVQPENRATALGALSGSGRRHDGAVSDGGGIPRKGPRPLE